MKGMLVVITGPQGSGKTSLRDGLLARNPSWGRMITHTSRIPRRMTDRVELHGLDYFFTYEEVFSRRANEFFEVTRRPGGTYGSSKSVLFDLLREHEVVVAVVDPTGLAAYKDHFGPQALTFVLDVPEHEIRSRISTRDGLTEPQKYRPDSLYLDLEAIRMNRDAVDHWVENPTGTLASSVVAVESLAKQALRERSRAPR